MEDYRHFSSAPVETLDLTLRLGLPSQISKSSNDPVEVLDLTSQLGLPSRNQPAKGTNGKKGHKPTTFKLKNVSTDSKKCTHCGNDKTPVWRKGPQGKHTLCNACGLRYARFKKKALPKILP